MQIYPLSDFVHLIILGHSQTSLIEMKLGEDYSGIHDFTISFRGFYLGKKNMLINFWAFYPWCVLKIGKQDTLHTRLHTYIVTIITSKNL